MDLSTPGLHLCFPLAHMSRALIQIGYVAVKSLSWSHKTLMPGWHVRRVCLLFVYLTMGSRGAILVSYTWRLDVSHARPACVPTISATCSGLLHVKTVCRAPRRRLRATCCSCTCAMTAPWGRCVASIRTPECTQRCSCQVFDVDMLRMRSYALSKHPLSTAALLTTGGMLSGAL
jgi:hypothetical protein